LADDTEPQERYIVPGLVRGLAILQAFSDHEQELGISDIARKIGTTRSTAFRLVYTLEHLGFLQKVGGSKRYRIGSRVLELGYSFLSTLDIVELAKPVLEKLRDDTNTSTHLIIRDGREVVYVARCNSRMMFSSTVGVGTRLPAHGTAPGRVLLSRLPTTEVVALYDGVKLDSHTSQTPTSIGALISQIEKDREESSIVSWGFFDPKVSSIAAPVFDRSGSAVAAVSVSCPMGTYDKDEFDVRIRQLVESAADEVSQALGFWRAAADS
jgi:DNA-binding IclR family transcriptional regulator